MTILFSSSPVSHTVFKGEHTHLQPIEHANSPAINDAYSHDYNYSNSPYPQVEGPYNNTGGISDRIYAGIREATNKMSLNGKRSIVGDFIRGVGLAIVTAPFFMIIPGSQLALPLMYVAGVRAYRALTGFFDGFNQDPKAIGSAAQQPDALSQIQHTPQQFIG
ncbi:MAG: hypothetical protein AAGI66_07695 [Cyanobacteria bacterium P01_H01_bin.74]